MPPPPSQPEPSHEDTERVRLVKALIDHGSTDLEGLLEMQQKGWKDEVVTDHFKNQRREADDPSPKTKIIWFQRMKTVFREIDLALKCVPTFEFMKFLDLGCCPGGFSSYILGDNPTAEGFGISLPVVEGGHEFTLEMEYLPRFDLSYVNLTYYQLGPSFISDERLHTLPNGIAQRSFDMAILDGHQLRIQSTALPWDRDRLLISQLILALQAVRDGGTIVIKLPLPHKPVAAKILFMFSVISEKLRGWKPKTMHGSRGTFYAVAKGLGRGRQGSRLPDFLLEFKKLWVNLTFGGDEGSGRYMISEDLNFLISVDDLIQNHLNWLVRFGSGVWKAQEIGLRNFYQKKGIL